MVVAEGPKIFDTQCIWERIFACLEKIFVFKYFWTIFHLVFTLNICGKSVTRTFSGAFFGCLYRANSTEIHLDVALKHVSKLTFSYEFSRKNLQPHLDKNILKVLFIQTMCHLSFIHWKYTLVLNQQVSRPWKSPWKLARIKHLVLTCSSIVLIRFLQAYLWTCRKPLMDLQKQPFTDVFQKCS